MDPEDRSTPLSSVGFNIIRKESLGQMNRQNLVIGKDIVNAIKSTEPKTKQTIQPLKL